VEADTPGGVDLSSCERDVSYGVCCVWWCHEKTIGGKNGFCHGDIVRGRLARTYASREGDMSW
jgi:hypothetical protein